MTNKTMTSGQKLLALREMRASDGWALWAEVMKSDVLNASFMLGDNPNMPEAEMHFRRGAIRAAWSQLTALDSLIQQFENDALVEHANAQAHGPDYTPNALPTT